MVGIDFSGGIASVVTQLNSALGSTFLQFSNPAGTTLRVLDDGAANQIDVNAASLTTTADERSPAAAPSFRSFSTPIVPYTGAFTAGGAQSVGFAGRITVNSALLADPSRLVVYQTSPLTPAADATRPNFIYDQLTSATLAFSPQSGHRHAGGSPFNGSLPAYHAPDDQPAGRSGGVRAEPAAGAGHRRQLAASSASTTHPPSMSTPRWRTLLKLQTAYGANARVMSTVKDLLDVLMRM